MVDKLPPPTAEQRRAWSFYGTPRTSSRTTSGSAPATSTSRADDEKYGRQVGEVRYIVGWMADQMVRMGWRVKINGSEAWSIRTSEGVTIKSEPGSGDIQTDPTHPANASKRLLEEIMWDSRTVREVTTNLFVAGELHYARHRDVWRVVSVIRPDREEIAKGADLLIRGIWPHPGDPEAPDAPLFGVLGVLDDLWWLNQLSRSQSANRVGMRGIIGVADTFKVAGSPDSNADDFWTDFEASLGRPMDDPTDVSPVGIVGPKELVEPSGNGMKGMSWVMPNFPYDAKIDQRMKEAVQRLAYGLPVPPEILLGLQAQSKATAFQVEGSTYRAHIEPVALLVAKIATDALSVLFPEEKRVEVEPDPTTILARRHSVQDVLEAFDRGAVGEAFLREILGFPDSAAPSDEERARRAQAQKTVTVDGVREDPANGAADEPVTAAVRMPADGDVVRNAGTELFDSQDSERLSSVLHTIDATLFAELVGAAHAAEAKVYERLGARVRASSKLRAMFPADLSNEELGRENVDAIMNALGADGDKIVRSALEPTLHWWRDRLSVAMGQTSTIIARGGGEVAWPADAQEVSALKLYAILTSAILGRPLTPNEAVTAAGEVRGLRESDLRAVLNISDNEPGVAMGGAARRALLGVGVQVVGHRWQWNPGRKGGIFDPHLERDGAAVFNIEGFVGDNAGEWGALPGQGVNAGYCMCTTRWLLRGADGRFLKEAPSGVNR